MKEAKDPKMVLAAAAVGEVGDEVKEKAVGEGEVEREGKAVAAEAEVLVKGEGKKAARDREAPTTTATKTPALPRTGKTDGIVAIDPMVSQWL